MTATIIPFPRTPRAPAQSRDDDDAVVSALLDRLEWMAAHDTRFRELLQRKGVPCEPPST